MLGRTQRSSGVDCTTPGQGGGIREHSGLPRHYPTDAVCSFGGNRKRQYILPFCAALELELREPFREPSEATVPQGPQEAGLREHSAIHSALVAQLESWSLESSLESPLKPLPHATATTTNREALCRSDTRWRPRNSHSEAYNAQAIHLDCQSRIEAILEGHPFCRLDPDWGSG